MDVSFCKRCVFSDAERDELATAAGDMSVSMEVDDLPTFICTHERVSEEKSETVSFDA
jgi:hypothetical protein